MASIPAWANSQLACGDNWSLLGRFSCDAQGLKHQEICQCLPPGYNLSWLWIDEKNGCFTHYTGERCQDSSSMPVCGPGAIQNSHFFCSASQISEEEICGCQPALTTTGQPWTFQDGCYVRSTGSMCFLPDTNLSGFWDPGLQDGTWRTDFNDPLAGTSSRPLTLNSCPYNLSTDPDVINGAGPTHWNADLNRQEACDQTSRVYPESNASTSDSSWPMDNFWVVSANNETSYGAEPQCADGGANSGPPNQSKKIGKPGEGVFGIDVVPTSGPWKKKILLSIDTAHFPNCTTPDDHGKIPFLSLGAQTGRGNGPQPITYLNDSNSPAILHFKATIEDLAPPAVTSSSGKSRVNYGYVFLETQWGGARRWIFLILFQQNPYAGPDQLSPRHWNWNIQESFWYPGADIVFVTADLLPLLCPGGQIQSHLMPASTGSSADYTIDLNKAFRCISQYAGPNWMAPMPDYKIPVTGIHWAIEQTYGPNWTTMSIQDIGLTW